MRGGFTGSIFRYKWMQRDVWDVNRFTNQLTTYFLHPRLATSYMAVSHWLHKIYREGASTINILITIVYYYKWWQMVSKHSQSTNRLNMINAIQTGPSLVALNNDFLVPWGCPQPAARAETCPAAAPKAEMHAAKLCKTTILNHVHGCVQQNNRKHHET